MIRTFKIHARIRLKKEYVRRERKTKSIAAICRRYRFQRNILRIISASLSLTTARSKVFHVWQRSLRRRVSDPSRG